MDAGDVDVDEGGGRGALVGDDFWGGRGSSLSPAVSELCSQLLPGLCDATHLVGGLFRAAGGNVGV